ncbi:MAG TPA: hypothetical protein VEH51_11765 [Burkholderiales bacterium]|nr:hypothetical protein [Burkholderiales bacterium]
MTGRRFVTLFFNDGTKLKLSFPKQGGKDAATLAANVRKAIDADRLVFEVEGSLYIIQVRNLKYVQVSPAPEALPAGIFVGAQIVG